MSHLSYRLYDRNGRRVSTANIKAAQRVDFILKNKILYSLPFPARYKKSSKEDDIDMFLTVYNEEIEAQKEITKLKSQLTRQKNKELRDYRKALLDKQKEEARQKKFVKDIEKDFEKLYKQDLKAEKASEKVAKIKEKIETPSVYKLTPEEEKQIKDARVQLRLQKDKLSRNIKGRIRLYLKDHLIDKRYFWAKDKEEDFIAILERAYGQLVKNLKDRSDETNFKKFIKRVTDSLVVYDSRDIPSVDDIKRMVEKRQVYEKELEAGNLEYALDYDKDKEYDYKMIKTEYKYYYSKNQNKNLATKRFIFNFDQQLSISPYANRDGTLEYSNRVKDIYMTLNEILIEEFRKLRKSGEIQTGKDYQIRFFIPQFNGNGDVVYDYKGGNGVEKKKSGYGISLPSKPFNPNMLDKDLANLFKLMKARIANYLSRNIGIIDGQFITGFMIITGV